MEVMLLLDGVSHMIQSVTQLLFHPWTNMVSKDIIELVCSLHAAGTFH
jgi:hypothetical protein